MAVYINRSQATAERLVKLRDYLYMNATPAHPVKASAILSYLHSERIDINIKTLYKDIETLRNFFNLDIEYNKHKKGYILRNPLFEPHELRMIVNSIQSARFITQQEADRLTDKIMNKLADEYTRPSLKRKTYIPNRVRTINEEAMKGLDTIHEAIRQNRKISYKYFEYTITGYDRTKRYLDFLGSKIITASPYRIIWANNKFWIGVILKYPKDIWYIKNLEYSEEEGKYIDTNGEFIEDGESIDFTCNFMDETGLYVYEFERLDLGFMEQIKILTEMREGEFIFKRELDDSFRKIIKLRVDKWSVSEVIGKFGNDVSFSPDGNIFFIATIHEELTPEIYMWTQEFFTPLEIICPENAEDYFKPYFLSLSRGEHPDEYFYRDTITFSPGDDLC